jgi:hypothetical protein
MKDGRLRMEEDVSEALSSEIVSERPLPKQRPRRAAALEGEQTRQRFQKAENAFKIADPQELASIEVFHEHPEIF